MEKRMDRKRHLEWGVLSAPMVIFLLLFLGFPALVNIVYSLSSVSFQTLRAPELSGFSNYVSVLTDGDFWRAIWFSLRFGVITALAECLVGFFLAIFLAPLFEKRSWLLAIIMLPLMVAPALVGLMYRLVLDRSHITCGRGSVRLPLSSTWQTRSGRSWLSKPCSGRRLRFFCFTWRIGPSRLTYARPRRWTGRPDGTCSGASKFR